MSRMTARAMAIAGFSVCALVASTVSSTAVPHDDLKGKIIPVASDPRPEVITENGDVVHVDLPIARKSTYTPAVENLREELQRVAPLAAKVTKLADNGPASGKYNVVFVGDGYTAQEQDQYLRDSRNIWNTMLTEEPFKSYTSSFNAYAVEVVSQDSGVDNDPPGVLRDTAMDMEVGCFDIARLMCVNTSKAKRYAANAPGADVIVAVGNTDAYAAGGYPGVSAVSARSYDAGEATLHEIGHSMGGLADEYFYDSKRYSGSELRAPNVSIYSESEMRRKGVKWAKHLGKRTPDGGVIGTYEGAMVSYSKGVYRPSQDSRMRNTFEKFNLVSVEALVAALKRRVPDAQPDNGTSPIPTPTVTATPTPTVTSTPTPTVTATATPTSTSPGSGEFVDSTQQPLADYKTVTSTLNSTFADASSVKIAVNINHECAEHLSLDIVTPDGRRNTLKRSSYGCRTQWNGEKSDTYKMRSRSDGPWKLSVADNYRGGTGTFNGWSITLN